MSLTKVSYSMISGNIFDVDDFGADSTGVADSAQAFRDAVTAAAANGGVVQFNGVYRLNTPVTGITSNMTVTGLGCSRIINGISSARGTDDALFTGTGSITNAGTITANFDAGDITVTVSTPANFAVGDVVTFAGDYIGRNISIVVDVTGSVLTLDRTASNSITSGAVIYKMTPIRNTVIGDFDIDFNGTTAAPRYGFGVRLTDAQNCRVQNINSQNIGSKVVEFSRCFDCIVSNVNSSFGTDNGGTGGHSYVVRYALCNDCLVENCVGNFVRHTVDMSGASRNTIRGCQGTGNVSATYLTHSNNCKDNLWQNNTSIESGTCAYQFVENLGDTGNTIDGGFIQNDLILRSSSNLSYAGTTIVKNLTVLNNGVRVAISTTGRITFQNCSFIASTTLISGQNAAAILTFSGCSFVLSALRSLASLSTNAEVIRVDLNNCEIDSIQYEGTIFSGGENTTLNLTGCNITANETTTNEGIFDGVTKEINAYNSTFRFFGTGGVYFFGANTNTTLTMDGCKFINSSDIARRYTVGVSMIIGQNQYINSALPSFANWSDLQTIGAVDIGTNAAPSTGAWLAGAKILFSTPPAGGNIGAVCTTSGTPGTWKTYGAIAA